MFKSRLRSGVIVFLTLLGLTLALGLGSLVNAQSFQQQQATPIQVTSPSPTESMSGLNKMLKLTKGVGLGNETKLTKSTCTLEPRRIRVPYTNENRPSGQPSCDCPYDRDKKDSICGGRSAYSRLRGEEPICYENEEAARQLWWNSPDNKCVDRQRTGQ